MEKNEAPLGLCFEVQSRNDLVWGKYLCFNLSPKILLSKRFGSEKKAIALLLYRLFTRCIKQVLGHNSPGKEGDGGFTHTAGHQSSGDNPVSRAARLPAKPRGTVDAVGCGEGGPGKGSSSTSLGCHPTGPRWPWTPGQSSSRVIITRRLEK